ncbi:NUDIX domain-containing protein [Patescibacteria group bacterium]|nr:NUDIX domain-containing protein [Patescibacteria group bacterium]
MNKKPTAGTGVIILKDNKVLLGKRNEDPEKADSLLHGEGTWTLPGGKLDFREDILNCAWRETYEETGIKINKGKLKLISVTNDVVEDAHFVTIGFVCDDFEGEARVMEPDITEWQWFELDNLPRPMFFPSEKMIKNFINKENKF